MLVRTVAGMIPQSFINGLVERVDIGDVVGKRVALKDVGGHQRGLCPFHDEKTPSFHVYPDGHYHCFGCGAHGTTLGFLMEMDGLSFPEAVEALAAFIGVEVPREGGPQRTPRAETDPLYDALAAAAKRFGGWLSNHAEGPAATAYLTGRGIAAETVRRFGIGLAPSGWTPLKAALGEFGEKMLVDAGLVVKNEQGRTYDRFRARIVFPIRDARGRVIGFGGRTYDGSGAQGEGPRPGDPKYLNSPETPVFRKGEEVYGLFEARQAERQLDHLVVVEGYMDVVALAGQGIGEAVATLGTAVGAAHFKRLFRHVKRVVCCFDGDAAGRSAAWRAVDAAFPTLTAGRELRFVFLPEGEDPDSLVRRRGAAHFRALVKDAVPVGDYFLTHLQAGLDLARVDHRATLCDLALPHIARLPEDGALRALLLDGLAALSDSDSGSLARRLPAASRTDPQPAALHPPPPPDTAPPSAEPRRGAALLHRLVTHPHLLRGLPPAERERVAALGGLLGEVGRFLIAQPAADTAVLIGHFMAEPGYPRLAELAANPPAALANTPADALAAEFAECVRHLFADEDRQRARALAGQARESGSLDDLRRLRDARLAQLSATG